MGRLAPVLLLFLCGMFAGACKKRQAAEIADAGKSFADAPDGWSTYADGYFSLSVPPGQVAKTGPHSPRDASPSFVLEHRVAGTPAGQSSFSPYDLDQRGELFIRDAAELELKDYVADGGKVLVGVRVIPMRTGSCAIFTAVSALDCREPNKDRCGQHHTLAYCDSPKKKRYLFIGNLGATGSVDQRPPGYAANAANFERILRSIEFKKD